LISFDNHTGWWYLERAKLQKHQEKDLKEKFIRKKIEENETPHHKDETRFELNNKTHNKTITHDH